ncbi:glutathione S-transferase family protein [Marinibactrum halimedae]|uniref:Glutathione S-transferase n=1 Tax=Marinibactrum halimedae TaxID=1444977 RepID=A0AA37T9I9_9GAMM|nr:glutathione S-transferase family protein [Marinibactrum halimedae]MCD9458644.1 glutathione S-transferase family protein [Marinibactrum halimedae]GLS25990.1 glutathione S-transferase [Marinibactrum halimedae]
MLTIYGFPFLTFNVLKVMLTAEYSGVIYRYEKLNPAKKEHKSPENLSRSLIGLVPTIETEEGHLGESGAICRYLAKRYQPALYGESLIDQGKVDQWVDVFAQEFGRHITTFFYQEVVRSKMMGQPVDAPAIEAAQKRLSWQLPIIDEGLRNHGHLVGQQLTIADLVAFAYLSISESTSFGFSNFEHINRFYGDIKGGEAFQKVQSQFEQ